MAAVVVLAVIYVANYFAIGGGVAKLGAKTV